MTFGTHQFTFDEAGDIGADTSDVAGELVSHGHGNRDRRLCPLIPLVNVEICSTYASGMNLDQDLVGSRLGGRHLFEPKANLARMFYQRSHSHLQTGFRLAPAER